jgi:hypothetical protein
MGKIARIRSVPDVEKWRKGQGSEGCTCFRVPVIRASQFALSNEHGGLLWRKLAYRIPRFTICVTCSAPVSVGSRQRPWYIARGFSMETTGIEVAFHKSEELREIDWQKKETFLCADFLADFRGEFHDICGIPVLRNVWIRIAMQGDFWTRDRRD